MQNKSKLTLPERQLANEMAALLAEKMWLCLSCEVVDGKVWDHGQSNFEAGCWVLRDLGIYAATKHNNSHDVLISVENVRMHMEAIAEIKRMTYEELLSAFIVNLVDYDTALASHRQFFNFPDNFKTVAEQLVHCGYAECDFFRIRWTEKISPVMKHWHIWDENSSCLEEIRKKEQFDNANKFLDLLPTSLKKKLSKILKQKGELAAIEIMQLHWNGNNWTDFPTKHATGIEARTIDGGFATVKSAFAVLQKEDT